MAKEKSGASPVILRTTLTQGAANGYIQSALLTGLSQGGNDALIIKEIVIEYPTFVAAAVGALEVESSLTRATKAAMANILDDDVIFKDKLSGNNYTSGWILQKGVLRYIPPLDLVIIEDTIYASLKSLNVTAAGVAYLNILAVPATVTDSEKVGLLLSRLN
jgi:hypothetical protein